MVKARNHRTHWTLADINYVETHYPGASLASLAVHLGRTVNAVKKMAQQLRLPEKSVSWWSETEKAVLLHHYENHTPMQEILALVPGRSRLAVMAKAGKMGLSRPKNVWSAAEILCMHQFYPSEGQHILRRLPDKSDEAIRDKASELSLASPGHTQARQWDAQEWLLLTQNRHDSPLALVSLFPDRSLSSIKNALARLKRMKDSDAFHTVTGGSPRVTTTWSDTEKAILIRWYETSKTLDDILILLPGRSRSSVFSLVRKLGLSRPLSDWTADELQILREYYPTEGSAIARRLPGRQTKTVNQKAFQLGIRMANSTPRQSWSAEEWQRLENHLHLSFPELQRLFPERSLSSLKNACHRAKARKVR